MAYYISAAASTDNILNTHQRMISTQSKRQLVILCMPSNRLRYSLGDLAD